MIRNVVFDIGGVLVRLRYQPFIRYLTEAGVDLADLPAWLATIDLEAHERGDITGHELLGRVAASAQRPLDPADLERRWLDMFDRSGEMFDLANGLMDGYRVYLLSNIGDLHWSHLDARIRHRVRGPRRDRVVSRRRGQAERRHLPRGGAAFRSRPGGDRVHRRPRAQRRRRAGLRVERHPPPESARDAPQPEGARRAAAGVVRRRTERCRPIPVSILLLVLSNVFMTFAWYAHLKNMSGSHWYVAALVSWGIALFEYLLQVPANRIGYTVMSPAAAQDPAGSDHAHGVRAVRRLLHAPAAEARLPVGRALHHGRRVLRVPQVSTAIHRRVEACRAGTDPTCIARLDSGWAVMGDPQVLPGYCLLLPDPVVPHLNAMPPAAQAAFLADMARLGDAVLARTGAVRINYAIVRQRRAGAARARVSAPCERAARASRGAPRGATTGRGARPFDAALDGALLRALRADLTG